ncbi:hypothetical protein [Sphingomonas sp.]|uniref:hypothetical protein n=1 Tax=Sphingomonas sp. TaxID=28214 RepID=UPI0035BC96C3
MLFFTPTQWLILALVLIAGWLFGLASHPGGRKWKARYAAERDANARYRSETDARLTDTRTGHDTALADARARIAELERENARLAQAAPVTAQTIAPRERVAVQPGLATGERVVMRPTASTAARPAHAAGERRGWFDWGDRAGR